MNPALQGYLSAMEESLHTPDALHEAAGQMQGVVDLVVGSTDLALAINDATVPVPSRRAVLDHLLDQRVVPEVQRLVHQAVNVVPAAELISSFRWLTSRLEVAASHARAPSDVFDEEVLGRAGSRNRVSGYAAAVFESVTVDELEEIEDELFRFARTVESNRPLRSALGDRELPPRLRQQVVDDLLGSASLPATRRLAAYAVRGGRARDFVLTLDTLVEAAARARGWRVARVKAADEVDAGQRQRLSEALATLAGNPVDLQVMLDPQLLAGVVVNVGDLRVDSTTRHRLEELTEHLHASEEAYRAPDGSRRRDTPDG